MSDKVYSELLDCWYDKEYEEKLNKGMKTAVPITCFKLCEYGCSLFLVFYYNYTTGEHYFEVDYKSGGRLDVFPSNFMNWQNSMVEACSKSDNFVKMLSSNGIDVGMSWDKNYELLRLKIYGIADNVRSNYKDWGEGIYAHPYILESGEKVYVSFCLNPILAYYLVNDMNLLITFFSRIIVYKMSGKKFKRGYTLWEVLSAKERILT